MEPPESKKPRIDSTSTSKHQALKEKQEARKVLFNRFKNGEIDKIIEEIKAQKAYLRAKKSNVKIFFEENVEKFWQFETFFSLLASELLAEPSKCNEKSFEALHESLKLLTAGCVSSSISAKSTPTEIFSNRNKTVSVPKLFTQILESGGDRMSTKTRVLLFDYISGLCTRKEGLIALSSFSAFIDQVAMCIASQNKEVRAAALSTVILVSNKKFFLKAFLNSNGGYYIGELLSQWNFDEIKTKETKVLTLFENFSTFDKRSFGRQIAASPGAQTLKELLFVCDDENTVIHKWHKLVIDLLMNAFELRDVYGRETIDRTVKEYDASDTKLKLLSCFAQDAWGRKHLRFSGGLLLIMEGCSETFDTKTFFIAKNLSCFMHDMEGLILICRNDAFLDKILFLLQKYCNETKDKDCPPPESKITLRPDSPNFLQHLEEKRQNMNITNFYVDFADLESSLPPQGSSSPRIRSAWSPSASTTSASPSPSPSPSRSSFSDEDSDAWISHPKKEDIGWYSDSESDEEKKEMCRENRRDKIILYLLDVIDWFTHYPENHLQLLRKPVFETLTALFSTELPITVIQKASRSIKRLIRSEESLPHLLGLKLHLLFISLIRRPCLMHRYADRCSRCEDKRKFGREVIQELSLQANSVPGWNFMQQLLKSDDPDTQFFAWSTALTLIRDVQFRSRLFYYFDVLTKLFDSFKSLLQTAANEGNKLLNLENVEEEQSNNSALTEEIQQTQIAVLKENESKLEAILFAFASLLSHKMQSSILETQTEPFPLDSTDEICRLENTEIPPEKQIRFKNAAGDLLVTADRDSLCRYSEYYRGMFENDFVEKLGHQQDFVFGNEGMYIKEDQFIKFIHLLSGCKKSECVAVDETSTCVSFIYLADKYLATELLETMFLPTGIAGRFITGSTLSSFTPIILTALSTHGRFSDLFFFVFLRYASMNEICDTLASSLSFRSGETFCDLFKEFLERCVSSLPIHQSYRLWI